MAGNRNISHPKYIFFDYLKNLLKPESEAVYAIDDLIDDLNTYKTLSIDFVLSHKDSEKILLQLMKFLHSTSPVVIGNAAFVLGTLAECENGRSKIISLMSVDDAGFQNCFDTMITLLESTKDTEIILNVAGTLGTLMENESARNIVLTKITSHSGFFEMINKLLISDNLWTASNAALIVARLTIDDRGNSIILDCNFLEDIIVNLIFCLGIDSAGKGMNAAFALGRIFDNEQTIRQYSQHLVKFKFTEKLVNILQCSDLATIKNVCFCLSSLSASNKGYDIILSNSSLSDLLLANISNLLTLEDDETIWFVVITLKSFSRKAQGCKLLRKHDKIIHLLKVCIHSPLLSEEVKIECQQVIRNLEPPDKPSILKVTLISPREIHVSWSYPEKQSVFELKSQLYYKQANDVVLAYRGKNTFVELRNMEPNTKYDFFLKFFDDIDESPESEHYIVTTDEDCKNVGQTVEKEAVVSGLKAETKYQVEVNAVNSCGKGRIAEIEVSTIATGAHAPGKPSVVVLGRSQVHITWNPPECPMGKIFRYEVKLNKRKIVFSGISTYCTLRHLKPDTEYSFTIIVITSEGRYESPPCKKRTNKEEYGTNYKSMLYEPRSTKESPSKSLPIFDSDKELPKPKFDSCENEEIIRINKLKSHVDNSLPMIKSRSSFSSISDISRKNSKAFSSSYYPLKSATLDPSAFSIVACESKLCSSSVSKGNRTVIAMEVTPNVKTDGDQSIENSSYYAATQSLLRNRNNSCLNFDERGFIKLNAIEHPISSANPVWRKRHIKKLR